MDKGTYIHERTPVAEFKENGFSLEQVQSYRSNYNLPALLTGADASVWMSQRTSESLYTAILPVQVPVMPLDEDIMSEIGDTKAKTKFFGDMCLNEWLVHPQSYAKAIIVIHKGKVVFEEYPGINEWEPHIWMSTAKPTASLVVDNLVAKELLDDKMTVAEIMPDWALTGWADIKLRDILDMTPGMNSEENDETRADPNSIATRLFNAEFGFQYNKRNETVPEVLRDAKPVSPPGTKLEYGSPTTQMLVLIAEAVSGCAFSDLFDKHVWSKVGAEAPLNIHLSSYGVAGAHGLFSSPMRGLARFGMLYTPSWNKTATEQVVSEEMIARVHKNVRGRDFFRNGFDGPVFIDRLNDDGIISNSHQWDAVWEDGDFWKSGLQTQGLYVSPNRDLVVAFYSTNVTDDSFHRFLRPLATSGLFD